MDIACRTFFHIVGPNRRYLYQFPHYYLKKIKVQVNKRLLVKNQMITLKMINKIKLKNNPKKKMNKFYITKMNQITKT